MKFIQPLSTQSQNQIWRGILLTALLVTPALIQILTVKSEVQAVVTAAISGMVLAQVLVMFLPSKSSSSSIVIEILLMTLGLSLLPQIGLGAFLHPMFSPRNYASDAKQIAIAWGVAAAVMRLCLMALAMTYAQKSPQTAHKSVRLMSVIFLKIGAAAGAWLVLIIAFDTVGDRAFGKDVLLMALVLGLWVQVVVTLLVVGHTNLMKNIGIIAPQWQVVAGVALGWAMTTLLPLYAPHIFEINKLMPLVLAASFVAVFTSAYAFIVLGLSFALLFAAVWICNFSLEVVSLRDPLVLILLGSVPLCALVSLEKNASLAIASAADVPSNVLSLFQDQAQNTLICVDLDRRRTSSPFGGAFGSDEQNFSHFFRGTEQAGLLNLLRELQRNGNGDKPVIRLSMAVRGSTNLDIILPFDVSILHIDGRRAWLCFVDISRSEALRRRVEWAESRLADSMLREERLLSVAAHELRTPVAILSMLGEEVKAGSTWGDVGESFTQALERLISILDDLRADSPTQGQKTAGQAFTPADLVQQLLDTFRTAAQAHAISIELQLSAQANLLMRGDYGRIFIALSKVLHNAIIHSKGSEVRLGLIVAQKDSNEFFLTWQVADNGRGLAAERRSRLFEAFDGETHGSNQASSDENLGLGLYTARKAIRLIGGDLILQDSPIGCHFLLSHPTRVVQNPVVEASSSASVSDVEPMLQTESLAVNMQRRALLIEDNRLVGEITRARLRRIFSEVDWAETGPAGLEMWQNSKYDIVFVDQLLPGMNGSDVVLEMRKSEIEIPVIGVTASTMGTECRDLEEAGATLALEKPLSLVQIRSLAEEYFPELALVDLEETAAQKPT